VERDWAVGKLKSLDLSSKKDLIDFKLTTLPKTRQTQIIGYSRSTLYYKPVPMSDTHLKILNHMNEIYTDNREYGYRMIHQHLRKNH